MAIAMQHKFRGLVIQNAYMRVMRVELDRSRGVLDAVFQRPGLHQSRINAYKMAVRWNDAGTIKLSIVDFTIENGGVQSISSSTHYTVDPGDLLAGGGFSVCGTYASGEYKVIDILTGIEVLNKGGEWIG